MIYAKGVYMDGIGFGFTKLKLKPLISALNRVE
jgi:hypothetical protein